MAEQNRDRGVQGEQNHLPRLLNLPALPHDGDVLCIGEHEKDLYELARPPLPCTLTPKKIVYSIRKTENPPIRYQKAARLS